MGQPFRRDMSPAEAVAAYKTMLAGVIDKRPSGTRQRLATALAKNRSFVSQITNPVYATPIPATHLDVVFEVCHFSKPEQRDFLQLYGLAHPKRLPSGLEGSSRPVRAVLLPDLGDDARNEKLHDLVSGFVRQLASLFDEQPEKGKRL